MGLDFGTKTVGVAVSDSLGITAQGVETITRKSGKKLRQTLARIETLIEEYQVEKIVLGLPKNMNNTLGARADETMAFQEMLERVLNTRAGLIGTIENRIGPLTIPARRTTPESYEVQSLLRQMADAGCTHVVMEVSSHALVQRRVEGLTFDVGVFTNLTQDHLDYHRTMEAYRDAKGLLFRQCRTAVLNLDDEAGRWYRERVDCPVFTYSENKDFADLTAKNIRLFPGHVEFEAVTPREIQRVHLPIPGGFTIYNALAAASSGLCLGLELGEIAAALRCAHGVKGRVEVVPTPTAYTVLIDYAHTPNALENVLLTARDLTAGRLICLFGCGGDRDKTKRPLMGAVVRELADTAVVSRSGRRPSAGPSPRASRGT